VIAPDLRGRSLLSLDDLDDAALEHLLRTAAAERPRHHDPVLPGKVAALVFLNPSLRTRTAAEAALAELSGHAVVLSPGTESWKWEFRRGAVMDGDTVEHVRDAIGTLSEMVSLVALRCFASLRSVEEDASEPVLRAVADACTVPVLNLESAQDHPLQSLADLLALREALGDDLRGKPMVLTWAPHPKALPLAVPHAVMRAASRAGMNLRVTCPPGFEPPADFLARVDADARRRGGSVAITHDRGVAMDGAVAVYAKSWGAPSLYGRWEDEKRLRASLPSWTVDEPTMARAPGARFMHCLPLRRNVVATDGVVEGPLSLVRAQARNRLRVQKAVFREVLRP
jgi:N-acetylornithine carbamoyltransferase